MPGNYEDLLDRIINSANTLDGNPLALLLPSEAGEGAAEIIVRGIKQLETSNSDLFIFVSPLRDKRTLALKKSGCSILIKDSFQTHPSSLLVDKDKATLLCKRLSAKPTQTEETFLFDLDLTLHALGRVCPQGKIIPIMIGCSDINKAIKLGYWVAKELGSHNPVIIALSKIDDQGLATAEFCDRRRFSQFARQQLVSQQNLESSYPPVVSALEFASLRGSNTFTTIASKVGQTKKSGTQIILTAAMLWAYHPPHFGTEQKNELLKIAIDSIEAYLKTGIIPLYTSDDPTIKRKSGVFITLRENSLLRGCIGRMNADEPLYKAVQKIAVAAATSDPRFSPLNIKDLKNITIKISVLSPLKKIDVDHIEIGKHGLLISYKGHRGVLLPEVPVERNWDADTFLAHLCMKAGLRPDILEENPDLYAFTSIEFSNRL